MKNEISMPAIVAIIVAVIVVLGVVGWMVLGPHSSGSSAPMSAADKAIIQQRRQND